MPSAAVEVEAFGRQMTDRVKALESELENPAPLEDKAAVQRLWIELLEAMVVVAKAERGQAQASVEAQQTCMEASTSKGVEKDAKLAAVEKQVTKLEGELRCPLKAKMEESSSQSGAPMPVLANVRDAVLGKYLSSGIEDVARPLILMLLKPLLEELKKDLVRYLDLTLSLGVGHQNSFVLDDITVAEHFKLVSYKLLILIMDKGVWEIDISVEASLTKMSTLALLVLETYKSLISDK
ncbi:hypothetical protein ACLOJK_007367 [Asimina triloba]